MLQSVISLPTKLKGVRVNFLLTYVVHLALHLSVVSLSHFSMLEAKVLEGLKNLSNWFLHLTLA